MERIKKSLSIQEAKVIQLLRDTPWGEVVIKQENGKVVHAEVKQSIKI